MASTLNLSNAHQLSLFHLPTLNNPQVNHPFKFSFNPNFSQIKSNHPKPFLKPYPSLPLLLTPSSTETPPPGRGAPFSGVWGPIPMVQWGRADFRVWSRRRAGSKAKSKRSTITVECTKCSKNRYTTEKHSLNTPGKLELSKYCPNCRLHTTHKEIK